MELDGCSNRCIPLPGFLSDMLEEHLSLHLGKYVISKEGSPIEPRILQNRLKNLLYEAGIKSASFQTLRNTFAERALENNFDVVLLSKIMGHASPSVTYGKYAKFVDGESLVRKNMENLAAAMRR